MAFMFCDSDFNKPIDKWKVNNVENMWGMFAGSEFNQDISGWKINKRCRTNDMFKNCKIKENYKPKH